MSTISDIPSDIRKDKMFNKLYSNNVENKNSYQKSLIDGGELIFSHDVWMNEEVKDFKKFLVWKYRKCLTVKDLLLATGGTEVLHLLSEQGSKVHASILINGFFQKETSFINNIMRENNLSQAVCSNLFSSFLEEGKVHAKTVFLNSMEISLGQGMKQQTKEVEKYLLEKYKNYPTMKELLKLLKTSSEALECMSKTELNMTTANIIKYFCNIYRMSFLDQMEEEGSTFLFSVTIFFAFHRDMSNLPRNGGGRRWPFRSLLKNIFSGVVSLFNRSKSNI